jgi:hypothetical protein
LAPHRYELVSAQKHDLLASGVTGQMLLPQATPELGHPLIPDARQMSADYHRDNHGNQLLFHSPR